MIPASSPRVSSLEEDTIPPSNVVNDLDFAVGCSVEIDTQGSALYCSVLYNIA